MEMDRPVNSMDGMRIFQKSFCAHAGDKRQTNLSILNNGGKAKSKQISEDEL